MKYELKIYLIPHISHFIPNKSMDFDFKKYHYRSMNATTNEERTSINQELKDLYASLNEDEKEIFNAELKKFLVKTVANIKDEYEAIKASSPSDN
jgi:hypothetical protein